MENVQESHITQVKFSHWQLPPRLSTFTGRQKEIDQLTQSYSSALAQRVVIASNKKISGTGGIGKTQLATEFSYQMIDRNQFDSVLWFNANSLVGDPLETEFRRLALFLKLDAKQGNISELVKLIYKILPNPNKTLLVFDGPKDSSIIVNYLPDPALGFALLVTSRDALAWSDLFGQLALDIFEPKEAVDYIFKVLPEDLRSEQSALDLANKLGHFPLALAQATAYIKSTNINIVRYLELFLQKEANQIKLLDKTALANDPHQETVWITVNLCLEQITSPELLNIINCCAYLAAELPIDEKMLISKNLSTSMVTSLNELKNLSLLEPCNEQHHVKIHQLVQQILMLGSDQSNRDTNLSLIVSALLHHFDVKDLPLATELRHQKLLPHLLTTKQHMSSAPINFSKKIAKCDMGIGAIYFLIGQYQQQVDHMQAAVEYFRQKQNLLKVVHILSSLSAGYDLLGKPDQSLQVLQETIKIIEDNKTLRADEYYFIAKKNLAERYLMLSDYKTALQLLTQAEQIAQQHQIYDRDISFEPKVMGTKATLYRAMGRWREALELQTQTLQLLIALFGEVHSDVAIAYDNLAKIYQALLDYDLAQLNMKMALDISIKLYGEHHPRVAMVYDNYGSCLYLKGNFDEAIELHKKAEKLLTFFYGENHVTLSVTHICLANCYAKQKQQPQARFHLCIAKSITEKVLGKNNPRYAMILYNLSMTYLNENDQVIANERLEYRTLLEECLRIRIDHFGPNNFTVANTLHQLALSYIELDERSIRMHYLNNALAILVRCCGIEDIRTCKTLMLVADLQILSGNTQLAAKNYLICLPTFAKNYGINHSVTQKCIQALEVINPNLVQENLLRFFQQPNRIPKASSTTDPTASSSNKSEY